MTMRTAALAALLVLSAVQPALAQNKKVYRCEDGAGRVTYSDEICRGGLALKNADERSADERKAAADVVKREEKLADKLARERRAEEKAARPAAVAHIPHSAAEKAAKDKPSTKPASKKKKTASAGEPQA